MKRTLIIGTACSGKSYAAKLLLKGVNYDTVNARDLRPQLYGKDADTYLNHALRHTSVLTEAIIVDEVHVELLERVTSYFYSEEFAIYPKGAKPFIIRPKEIVIICTCDLLRVPFTPSFTRRFQVIQCHEANSAGITMIMVNPVQMITQHELQF